MHNDDFQDFTCDDDAIPVDPFDYSPDLSDEISDCDTEEENPFGTFSVYEPDQDTGVYPDEKPLFQAASGPVGEKMNRGGYNPLDFLVDYNRKFRTADPCLFRDEVTAQLFSILISKSKPNCLLTGPAGCGKTKIVEDTARMIANNDPLIPDQLQDCIIYELPLSSLVSGSGIVGDVEEKTKCVVDFLQDPNNRAICFIDEIHLLFSSDPVYSKIAQLLKPVLARGEIRMIGATTSQEAVSINTDPAFCRRFSRLIVDELTKAQTVTILDMARRGFARHYGLVEIPDSLLPEIVRLADQFNYSGNHRPDNALTLMDRTIGDAVVSRHIQIQQHLVESNEPIYINKNGVETTALRLMTGNSRMLKPDYGHLKHSLKAIRGQDENISTIIEAIRRRNSPYFEHSRPLTMMFAGYSGTGKTETAKILARELIDMKPIILNMTEYSSSASINRLIGSPAGYIGSDSRTELPFDVLESNPYQLILLDEFEKCDNAVQKLFMAAFDEGYIRQSNGRQIDFSKSIIISTTNASHSNFSSVSMGITPSDQEARKSRLIQSLSSEFPLELLNRFDEIIEFSKLDKTTYQEILKDLYAREVQRLKSEFMDANVMQLPVSMPPETAEILAAKTWTPQSGARPANAAVRRHLDELLAGNQKDRQDPDFDPSLSA